MSCANPAASADNKADDDLRKEDRTSTPLEYVENTQEAPQELQDPDGRDDDGDGDPYDPNNDEPQNNLPRSNDRFLQVMADLAAGISSLHKLLWKGK